MQYTNEEGLTTVYWPETGKVVMFSQDSKEVHFIAVAKRVPVIIFEFHNIRFWAGRKLFDMSDGWGAVAPVPPDPNLPLEELASTKGGRIMTYLTDNPLTRKMNWALLKHRHPTER